MKTLSPTAGIGLGILAALEKSGETEKALCSRSFSRSDPIPVKNSGRVEEIESSDSLEDYTYVTSHRPGKKSVTKVYKGNTGECGRNLIDVTPARLRKTAAAVYPTSSFLSWCGVCSKNLEGKDIYMYGGKGFCSTECRSMQISMDEKASSSSSSISRSVKVSNSACSNNNPIFFSTGILAV
jgi:hypothetical protein